MVEYSNSKWKIIVEGIKIQHMEADVRENGI